MQSSPAPSLRHKLALPRFLWLAGAAAVALHGSHTVFGLGSPGPTHLFSTWLPFGAFLLAAASCLARSACVRDQRGAWLAMGTGLFVYAFGLVYYNLLLADDPPAHFPTVADLFWLALGPAGLTALVLLVRSEAKEIRSDRWLDGLIGGLAVASIGVTVLFGVVLNGPLAAPAANLTFTLLDLLVVGFAVATWGLFGWRPPRSLVLFTLGFAALAVEDSVYLHELVRGTLTPGTLLDSCWLAIILIIASGALLRPRPAGGMRTSGGQLVVVPFGFALTAVALAAYFQLGSAPHALAALLNAGTLAAVVVRFALTSRSHLEMLADLRRSEQRLGIVLDTMSDGLVATDANGDYVIFNRAAENILGDGPEDVFLSDGVTQAPEEALPLARALMGETVRRRELVIRDELRPEGCWVEVSAAPLNDDGRPAGAVATFRDVTERKQTEAALARKEGAERANQAKSEFLSRVSHELRTPLNSIIGFAQLLEMDQPDPHQRENVEHILKGGRHLLDLINEVLDISKIEAGTMGISLETVHFDGVISEALDLVEPLAVERGVRLEKGFAEAADRYVGADRQRLKQVLLNLFSNAIKYNQERGLVAIAVEEPAADRLRVLVTDTGIGMGEEQLERLFTPFERLGAEHGIVEGTGLGLALSKRLVEVMGGTLAVESEPGTGTTVALELARARASEVDRREFAAASTTLYIEDNLPNYKLVERILSRRRPGTKLLPAMHGSLGLELAHRHRPDLVLLDLHMPGMPGDEVLRRLKQDPCTRDIPVVLVSADTTAGQAERLLELGAEAYLGKPLDVTEFLRVVDRALAKGADGAALR